MRSAGIVAVVALLAALAWWGQAALVDLPDVAYEPERAPAPDVAGHASATTGATASAVRETSVGAAQAPPVTAHDVDSMAAFVRHALPDPARCLAGTGRSVREQRVAVHRWVDARGVTHYSDRPPSGAVQDYHRSEVAGLPPVSVRARGEDTNRPSGLEQDAVADALMVDRVLREGLGVDAEAGLALEIVFVASAEAYAKRIGQPALAASAGAYSSKERAITVRLQPDEHGNRTVVRHEIAHALLHERVGLLPVAINEGLAAWFERATTRGMGVAIDGTRDRSALREAAAVVAGSGDEALVDLLAREGEAFYAPGREARYLHAYALVAVLMARTEGRKALGGLLAAQRAESCRPVDAPALLEGSYPGGLAALARDWAAWLRDPPASQHVL